MPGCFLAGLQAGKVVTPDRVTDLNTQDWSEAGGSLKRVVNVALPSLVASCAE